MRIASSLFALGLAISPAAFAHGAHINLSQQAQPVPVTTTDLQRLDLETVWHPLTQHRHLDQTPPIAIESASGCFVVAEGGRRYLDGVSGLWCVNVGHGREEGRQLAAEVHEKQAGHGVALTAVRVVRTRRPDRAACWPPTPRKVCSSGRARVLPRCSASRSSFSRRSV